MTIDDLKAFCCKDSTKPTITQHPSAVETLLVRPRRSSVDSEGRSVMICPKCFIEFSTCGEFNIHDCPADPSPKVLLGEWRHNNGYVCCGSMRIFKTDIDTNPSDAFTNELLDWVVSRLNRT